LNSSLPFADKALIDVPSKSTQRLAFYCCGALLALALFGQLNGIDGAFLSDDYGPVEWLFRASNGEGLWSWIVSGFYRPIASGNLAYRPVTYATFVFDWLAYETNATGWRVTNVAIFASNAAIAGLIVVRWIGRQSPYAKLAGWVTACTMAAYPFAGEVAAWPVGRIDLLACFFSLLYLAVMPARTGSTLARHLLRVLFLLLALMSKESAMLLPAIATLLIFVQGPLNADADRIGLRARMAFTIEEIWPTWFALGAYLLWREFLFGSFWRVYRDWQPTHDVAQFVERLAAFRHLVAGTAGPRYVLWSLASIVMFTIVLGSWVMLRKRIATPYNAFMLILLCSSLVYFAAPALSFPAAGFDGEGGRNYYVPWIYVALLVGMLAAWTSWQWFPGFVFACLMLGAQSHSLSQWHDAAAQMKPIVGSIEGFAATVGRDQYALLLLPDHIGIALFARNAQGAIVNRPAQRLDHIDRIAVMTSNGFQTWSDHIAHGEVAKLKRIARFDPDDFLGVYCWNAPTRSIVPLTPGGNLALDAAAWRRAAEQRFSEAGCMEPF
jgi:hypothetical protein